MTAEEYERRPEVKTALKLVRSRPELRRAGGLATYANRLMEILGVPPEERKYEGGWVMPLEFMYAQKRVTSGWSAKDAFAQVVKPAIKDAGDSAWAEHISSQSSSMAPIRKPDPEQIQLLQRDMDNLVDEAPEIAELFDLLLSMGGHAVVPVKEEDLQDILDRGYLRDGRGAKKAKGEPIKCHRNAALLWDANRDRAVIVTGWAMSADGLWRQHSWVRDTETDQIYETTLPRKLYFGFDMTPEEAEKFYYANDY